MVFQMDLKWMVFEQLSHLIYQAFSIPFALIYYCLTRQGYITLTNRYIYLTLGGCVLGVVSMGPYCALVFVPAVASVLLLVSKRPVKHIHAWVFWAQMFWQSLWHLLIQYQEYWRGEPADNRLLLAVSSLMLLTQRVTSVSLDVEEGKVSQTGDSSTSKLCYLSYLLYFPALLGGPLCSFRRFVSFVERSASSPPPNPLPVVCLKAGVAVGLQWARHLLVDLIEQRSAGVDHLGTVHSGLILWGVSLVLRLCYYSHWALSEALNNAAGLGFSGYSGQAAPLWGGLSDGNPWTLETSTRLSEFTRRWNGTTAAWLRRLVFCRCTVAPLWMTFGFSAWWHGLHPAQALGFLMWGSAVQAERSAHRRALPLLTSPARRLLYRAVGWLHTQLVITCVMLTVDLRCTSFIWPICRTYICVFPLLYITLLFFRRKNNPENK